MEISEKFDKKIELTDLNKLQNRLLEMAFEKEFKAITNHQEAKEFLKRLQGFETERVQIGEIKDGKAIPDASFKKYYDSKFDKLSREYSFSDEDKEKYSYKNPKMKPQMTAEEENDYINTLLAVKILNLEYEYDYEKTFSQQYMVKRFKLKNNTNLIFMLNKNTKQLSMFPVLFGDSSEEEKKFFEKIDGIESLELLEKLENGDIEAEKIDFDPENKVNELIEDKKNNEKATNEEPKGILSRVFERLRNLFKKPSNPPMLMSPQNTPKEDMEEEELPAWDMRNWSEEDIEKAKVEAEKDDRKRERDDSEKGIQK